MIVMLLSSVSFVGGLAFGLTFQFIPAVRAYFKTREEIELKVLNIIQNEAVKAGVGEFYIDRKNEKKFRWKREV